MFSIRKFITAELQQSLCKRKAQATRRDSFSLASTGSSDSGSRSIPLFRSTEMIVLGVDVSRLDLVICMISVPGICLTKTFSGISLEDPSNAAALDVMHITASKNSFFIELGPWLSLFNTEAGCIRTLLESIGITISS